MDLSTAFRQLAAPDRAPEQKALATGGAAVSPPANIFLEANSTRLAGPKWREHLETFAGKQAIDWVYDCAELIAEAVARADYHFDRDGEPVVAVREPEQPAEDVSEAPDDLVALLRAPNPYCTWQELVQLLVIDWLVIGNSFWLRHRPDASGKPRALYRLLPQYVELVPGKSRLVDQYLYRVPSKGEPIAFSPEQVIHFKRPNPHSEYVGAGVIKAGARVYDMEIALTRTLTEYFEQGTRLSGVLESDRSIPSDTWARTKAQFMALYAGAGNSYKVAALSHGMKFKPIQATAAEAEFRYLVDVSRDRILAMFRVPPPLLGITGGFDRQAVKEAQRIFDNKTVRPIADSLQAALSRGLTQAWELDYVIEYEYQIPIEDKLDLAASVAVLPGIKVHEVRETAGFGRLGQDFTMPDGTLIDDAVLNMPGENTNESEVKDQPIGDEPGRPPKPENTQGFPTGGGGKGLAKNTAVITSKGKALDPDAALAQARAALDRAQDAANGQEA